MEKRGIVLGGTLIVDEVKIVDVYPGEGTLANILETKKGVGGCPTNNSLNLKILDPDLPVAVVGRIGDDENGRYVMENLHAHHIDTSGVTVSQTRLTSYTDVMTVKDSGNRTFFHDRGANAEWDVEHIPFDRYSQYKIAQIGYILLLNSMDAEDSEYGTRMARAFARFQDMGLKTAVDVVSEVSDRFTRLVTPALQYVDYLIFNEIEAGQTVGTRLRTDDGQLQGHLLRETSEKLLEAGRSELVVIHMPEGSYALTRDGEEVKMPSFLLPKEDIRGAVGAGDAFCSGVLYCLEQDLPLKDALYLGTTLAACNLFSPTSTGGALSLEEARRKAQQYPQRPLTF